MRWALVISCILSVVAPVMAQEQSAAAPTADTTVVYMTRGDFAVAVCKYMRVPETEALPALIELQRLEMVPEEWTVLELITYGDVDEFLDRIGVPDYQAQPSNWDHPATRDDVAAILRRYASRLRDYWARRVGHGMSIAHVTDEGVDRAVSPIYPH